MKTIKRLTPKEEQVMLTMWKFEAYDENGKYTPKKVKVHELVENYQENGKAYNTISTQVRILEQKKFIKHKPHGRGYLYYPVISKSQYREFLENHIKENY